jgi:4-hydroxy-tetrahydrodipicolinate synthase
MKFAGILRNDTVRPPTHAPNTAEIDQIRAALHAAGVLARTAAE